jgi:hypothetical protein
MEAAERALRYAAHAEVVHVCEVCGKATRGNGAMRHARHCFQYDLRAWLMRTERTANLARLKAEVRAEPELEEPSPAELEALRPRERSDCERVPRPCPFVGCRYHLYLEVKGNGSVVFSQPGLDPTELPERASCVLDLVEDHPDGMTLAAVGTLYRMGRERVRQIEAGARRALRARGLE